MMKRTSIPAQMPNELSDRENAMENADSKEMGEISRVLNEFRSQPKLLQEKLYPLVYEEMKQIARRQMPHGGSGITLQPSVLVSEAFLRLSQSEPYWKNRGHFYGMAANIMRNIVVDYARRRNAEKRGSGVAPAVVDDLIPSKPLPLDIILDVHRSLDRLEQVDPVAVKLIELTFFSGLTVEEATEEACLKPTTAKAKLRFAKAWLNNDLSGSNAKP